MPRSELIVRVAGPTWGNLEHWDARTSECAGKRCPLEALPAWGLNTQSKCVGIASSGCDRSRMWSSSSEGRDAVLMDGKIDVGGTTLPKELNSL